MSLDAVKKKAKKALMDAKYDVALPLYIEIHKEEPNDLRIFTKVAEMQEKTGDKKGALRSYTAIAKAYADDGFVVQAIAINKLILRLDPKQTEITERLKDLSSERGDDWAVSTMAKFNPASISSEAKKNIEQTPLLSGLSGDELADFISSLQLKECKAGETIFKEGEPGDCLYLIGMGTVHLEATSIRGKQQTFSNMEEGDFFGEMSFMNNKPQMNTAVAETDVTLLLITRAVFDDWVKKHPSIHEVVEDFYRKRVLARILAISPVFEGIPNEARVPLAQQFTFSFFHDGDVIVKEGDIESVLYLIRSGQVEVSTQSKKDASQKIVLGALGEGSFFGEVSMLTNRPRTATVSAKGDVEVLALTGDKFNQISEKYPTVKKVVAAYLKQRVVSTIQTLKDNS